MAENKYSKSTQELLDIISKEKNLDFNKFQEEYKDNLFNKSLSEVLINLINEKNAIYGTIQRDLGMSKSYFYDLINGKKKNPSRDILLAIMFVLHCTPDEIQSVLRQTGYSHLDARRERDVIIYNAAAQGYSLITTNIALEENNFPIIKTMKDNK